MLTQSLDIDNVIMLGNPDEKVIESMYYKMFGLCFRIKDMKVKSYVPSTYILAVLRYNTIRESATYQY